MREPLYECPAARAAASMAMKGANLSHSEVEELQVTTALRIQHHTVCEAWRVICARQKGVNGDKRCDRHR